MVQINCQFFQKMGDISPIYGRFFEKFDGAQRVLPSLDFFAELLGIADISAIFSIFLQFFC